MSENKFTTPFEPIIKTTPIKKNNTLNDKHVDIKGTNDFSRSLHTNSVNQFDKPIKKEPVKSDIDPRYLATKTAKVSPDVLLKLNTLKPFIKELEEMDKTSINHIMDMLIESYVHSKLTVRQSEGYKTMYKNLFEMLPK